MSHLQGKKVNKLIENHRYVFPSLFDENVFFKTNTNLEYETTSTFHSSASNVNLHKNASNNDLSKQVFGRKFL